MTITTILFVAVLITVSIILMISRFREQKRFKQAVSKLEQSYNRRHESMDRLENHIRAERKNDNTNASTSTSNTE